MFVSDNVLFPFVDPWLLLASRRGVVVCDTWLDMGHGGAGEVSLADDELFQARGGIFAGLRRVQ